MLCFSILASLAPKVSSEKPEGAEDRLPKMSPKFAPRCEKRAVLKPKSLQTGSTGALFEVQSAFPGAGTGAHTQQPHKNH